MIYVILDLCVSYLFFYSRIAFLVLLPGIPVFLRQQRKACLKRQKREMLNQFMNGIQLMAASLQAGYSAENALKEAAVFLTAKRSGGDLLLIIRNTTFCIRQKQETMQEIETALSGKIMEQNIMSMIPLLILAYVKIASPEFLEGLYGNAAGAAVMSICFGVYVAAYFWGRKIVQIEV